MKSKAISIPMVRGCVVNNPFTFLSWLDRVLARVSEAYEIKDDLSADIQDGHLKILVIPAELLDRVFVGLPPDPDPKLMLREIQVKEMTGAMVGALTGQSPEADKSDDLSSTI